MKTQLLLGLVLRLRRMLRLTPFPWNPRQCERKYCLNVIDFANARLSLRRLGNNKQGGCAMHTAKTKRDNFQINLKSSLFVFGSSSNTLFVIALALLVIPAGFEPTTHSLEGCCSIQLSYGTILCRNVTRCAKRRSLHSAVQK